MANNILNGVSVALALRAQPSAAEAAEQAIAAMRSLKEINPRKFVELVCQFEREASEAQENLIGEDHPFARLFAKPRDPESIQRLEEGIKEPENY